MELFAFCLFCFVFVTRQDTNSSLNVLPGKRAAAVVLDAGAHRHLCAALGTGQAEELVFRPERAARKVSFRSIKIKGGREERMENYSEAVLCVSQQRNRRSEEDACRVSVLFQSDSDPPVSVKLHVLFSFSKSPFVQMIFNPFSFFIYLIVKARHPKKPLLNIFVVFVKITITFHF